MLMHKIKLYDKFSCIIKVDSFENSKMPGKSFFLALTDRDMIPGENVILCSVI